jgi:hypothetical protein
MNKSSELYEKRVSLTLAGFQLTELLLKDYMATAYDVTRKLLDGVIEFSPSRKDIESHSLERLCIRPRWREPVAAVSKSDTGEEALWTRSVCQPRFPYAIRCWMPELWARQGGR